MKKQILLSLALAMFMGVAAQDTIHTRSLKDGYFYNVWPFDTIEKSVPRLEGSCGWPHKDFPWVAKNFYTQDTLTVCGIAVALYDEDTVHFLPTSYRLSYENTYEYFALYKPSADTIQRISDSLLIHQRHTPIAYYMDFDYTYTTDYSFLGDKFPLLEVYEAFFTHPYRIEPGTFYIGRTTRSDNPGVTDSVTGFHYYHETPQLVVSYISLDCWPNPEPKDTITIKIYWEEFFDSNQPYELDHEGFPMPNVFDTTIIRTSPHQIVFLYPILTPPDSTVSLSDTVTADSLVLHSGNSLVVTPGSTLVVEGDTLVVTDSLVIPLGDTVVIAGHPFVVNPGDTLVVGTGDTLVVGPDGSVTLSPGGTVVVNPGSGSSSGGDGPGVAIRQTDLVYRYTAVAPNPALDHATVTSSFGISRLEAYDAQGRLVYDSHNLSTFSFQLSTVEWPRGTYLLRITTPLGPTTKKLIVQ